MGETKTITFSGNSVELFVETGKFDEYPKAANDHKEGTNNPYAV
jgi:hypothetical protein